MLTPVDQEIITGLNHLRELFCADFPGTSREKQNSNCVREKSLFYEAVDNLAQRCKQLGISFRIMLSDVWQLLI